MLENMAYLFKCNHATLTCLEADIFLIAKQSVFMLESLLQMTLAICSPL